MSVNPDTGVDSDLAINYETDWKSRLRRRLYTQFANLPVWQNIADTIAHQAQDLENALQSILTILSIDDSTGAQLQALGRVVKQPYTGESDDIYRLRLRARIRANISAGGPEDLYAVFRAMFGITTPGGYANQTKDPPATVIFTVTEKLPLTLTVANVLLDLLTEAVLGGVRLLLEFQTAPTRQSFQFNPYPAPQLTVLTGVDGYTVEVTSPNDLAQWPPMGFAAMEGQSGSYGGVLFYTAHSGGQLTFQLGLGGGDQLFLNNTAVRLVYMAFGGPMTAAQLKTAIDGLSIAHLTTTVVGAALQLTMSTGTVDIQGSASCLATLGLSAGSTAGVTTSNGTWAFNPPPGGAGQKITFIGTNPYVNKSFFERDTQNNGFASSVHLSTAVGVNASALHFVANDINNYINAPDDRTAPVGAPANWNIVGVLVIDEGTDIEEELPFSGYFLDGDSVHAHFVLTQNTQFAHDVGAQITLIENRFIPPSSQGPSFGYGGQFAGVLESPSAGS